MNNELLLKPSKENGFSLIEVLLAIGILGGAIVCLLGLFTPVLLKTREIERTRDAGDIEGKINGFIQVRSFNEIFTHAKEGVCIYFYNDAEGMQRVTKDIDEIDGNSIIRVKLNACSDEDIAAFKAEEYAKSYLPICVGIYCLKDKSGSKNMQSLVSSFITIKNR